MDLLTPERSEGFFFLLFKLICCIIRYHKLFKFILKKKGIFEDANDKKYPFFLIS